MSCRDPGGATLAAGLVCVATLMAAPARSVPWTVAPGRHDRSPLPVNDLFLLGAPVLRLEPTSPEVTPAGSWSWRAALSSANSYSRAEAIEVALEQRGSRAPLGLQELRGYAALDPEPTAFLVDGEVERLEFAAKRGLGRGWQLGVTLPLFETGGGFLDGPIESYHDALGFTQQGRDGLPKDGFLLYLDGPTGELYWSVEPGSGVGEPTLAAERGFARQPLGVELALRAAVKLPTTSGRSFHGTGSLDLGLEAHARRCGGAWCGHGSAGVYGLGDWELVGLDERTVVAGALGLQLLLPAGNSLLSQMMCETSPLEPLAIAELSGDACEISSGWRWSGSEAAWTLAFTENLFVSDTGSDFTLHLLWAHGR